MSPSLSWIKPTNLLDVSIAAMRPHGIQGNEGLALWLGRSDGEIATITHVVAPCGPGFQTTPLHMHLSFGAMARLTELASRLGIYLVGQIHSHPGLFLDLSEVDEELGIRCQDYLSVVCPYYAQRQLDSFEECGVHVFDDNRYRRLALPELRCRVRPSNSLVELIHLEVPA